MTRLFLLASVLVIGLPWLVAAQDAHVAVIVGLGGEPEHAETFQRSSLAPRPTLASASQYPASSASGGLRTTSYETSSM